MRTVPESDDGLERLGDSEDFASELERLVESAPEPWRSRLIELVGAIRKNAAAT
jgi:hypothetical protein